MQKLNFHMQFKCILIRSITTVPEPRPHFGTLHNHCKWRGKSELGWVGQGETLCTVWEGKYVVFTQIGFYSDFWGYNEVGTLQDRKGMERGLGLLRIPESLICYYP